MRNARRQRRGFTLIEAVVSVALVGVLTSAILTSVASTRATLRNIDDRARGLPLALDLINEILLLPYMEPGASSSAIGLDSGENTGNRSLFDDVDDYNGYNETVPQTKSGTLLAGFSDFSRSVSVQWINGSAFNTVSSTDVGIKRITVRVKRGTVEVAKLVAYRATGGLDASLDQASLPDVDQ